MHEHVHFDKGLVARLRASALFRNFQKSFQLATGLPLVLAEADNQDGCACVGAANNSPFCEMLQQGGGPCAACAEANGCLHQIAAPGPGNFRCFAGMTISAVPVKLGGAIVAFLKTGQVFCQRPQAQQFDDAMRAAGSRSSGEELERLRDAYVRTQDVDPERLSGAIFLLQMFAEQLAATAHCMTFMDANAEPRPLSRARRYIQSRLGEHLTLDRIARVAGMSEAHFCRVFKQFTGLTLTAYINRSRMEWAKLELLRHDQRISEVAFKVGFQSLSQFNRSFRRWVGLPPSSWRKKQFADNRRGG